MCGIVCAFNVKGNKELIRSNVLKMAKKSGIVVQIGVESTQMIMLF
ncbi:MAG: hypothetical protein CM15mP102_11230 [Flavobacteriales bacterium]|nr:MAG: hypothetical protein CM15mP102_11230 [Flavobacteriales bacterium]